MGGILRVYVFITARRCFECRLPAVYTLLPDCDILSVYKNIRNGLTTIHFIENRSYILDSVIRS